jgi:hypothetical protein
VFAIFFGFTVFGTGEDINSACTLSEPTRGEEVAVQLTLVDVVRIMVLSVLALILCGFHSSFDVHQVPNAEEGSTFALRSLLREREREREREMFQEDKPLLDC